MQRGELYLVLYTFMQFKTFSVAFLRQIWHQIVYMRTLFNWIWKLWFRYWDTTSTSFSQGRNFHCFLLSVLSLCECRLNTHTFLRSRASGDTVFSLLTDSYGRDKSRQLLTHTVVLINCASCESALLLRWDNAEWKWFITAASDWNTH